VQAAMTTTSSHSVGTVAMIQAWYGTAATSDNQLLSTASQCETRPTPDPLRLPGRELLVLAARGKGRQR
jgi:hypothetical protein